MRSLEVLFVIFVVGLASFQVFGRDDESNRLPIFGKEIKRIMTHPDLKVSCDTMPENSTLAYVTLFNDPRPYRLFCRKGERVLPLKFLLNGKKGLYDLSIGASNTLSRTERGESVIVGDEEEFSYVSYGQTSGPFVPDNVKQVALSGMDKETLDAIFRNAVKIFACIDQNSHTLHLASSDQSLRMLLNCEDRTIRLLDEKNDPVYVFVGSQDVLLDYDGENQRYGHNEVEDIDRWVWITCYDTYTTFTNQPLYSKHAKADITIPLAELKNDLADLRHNLVNSKNRKGAVVLGDKVIINLTKNPRLENDIMQVGGKFETEGSRQIFFKDDFYDENGVKITPRNNIQTFSHQGLSDISVEDYVDIRTLRGLFSLHSNLIEHMTINSKLILLFVDYVYKKRSVLRAEHALGDVDFYRIDNMRTLTTVTKDGQVYAENDVHTLSYYIPNYDGGRGGFLTSDTPLKRNIFAIRLKRYQPPEKGTFQLEQLLENETEDYQDWEIYIRGSFAE